MGHGSSEEVVLLAEEQMVLNPHFSRVLCFQDDLSSDSWSRSPSADRANNNKKRKRSKRPKSGGGGRRKKSRKDQRPARWTSEDTDTSGSSGGEEEEREVKDRPESELGQSSVSPLIFLLDSLGYRTEGVPDGAGPHGQQGEHAEDPPSLPLDCWL